MILRRIATGIKNQDWFVVFIELIVLVLGIYIGLQVDDWNKARLEIQQEEAIIERLKADYSFMEEEALLSVKFHEEVVEAMQVVVEALEAGYLDEKNRELFEMGLRLGNLYRTSPDRAPTLTEILSSGQTSLIRDKILLNEMIKHNAYLDNLNYALQANTQTMLGNQEVYSRQFKYDLNANLKLADRDFFLSAIGEYDFEAMARDPEFINAAYNIREGQKVFLNWRQIMLTRIRKIKALLEGETQ